MLASLYSLLLLFGQPGPLDADTAITEDSKPLIVATKESPPFAFRSPDGQWTGISIELWQHLASDLKLKFEFRESPLDQILKSLESGEVDAAVAAITVTAERNERVEFCHPHFTTGLGIAAANDTTTGVLNLLQRIVSKKLIILVVVMVSIILACGVLFWYFERNLNQQLFGGKRRKGIGMGMWWSTILLLGHKGVLPISTSGRLLAGSAMIASIMLLSILTGVIASVLTVGQLDVGISQVSDLRHVRTATVKSSTSESYLRDRRIPFRSYATVTDAMNALAEDREDALVYDAALLNYIANAQYRGKIHVLPITFHMQEYAIALPPDSELRKPLNRSLLRFRASDEWNDLIYRYLGDVERPPIVGQ